MIGIGPPFNQNNHESNLESNNVDQDNEVIDLLATAQKWRMNAQKSVSDKR